MIEKAIKDTNVHDWISETMQFIAKKWCSKIQKANGMDDARLRISPVINGMLMDIDKEFHKYEQDFNN